MDIIDALSSREVPSSVKHLLIDILDSEYAINIHSSILTPTATNDDVNGSQHAAHGGNDFTYEDISEEQLYGSGLTFGVYEYFSREGAHYTGHYYNGEDYKFAALVLNPPAYAVTYH